MVQVLLVAVMAVVVKITIKKIIMKKIALVFIIVLFVWFVSFVLFTIDIFTTIKYEIESTNNENIISKVYQLADTLVVMAIVLFIVCTIFALMFLFKKRETQSR